MKRIEAEITIDAPARVVWDVITDVDRYPEWNRFTPRIRLRNGGLSVGTELDLQCWISERTLLPNEREVILAVDAERFSFCMGTSRIRGRPGIRSQRWQICTPLDGGRTRFLNHESFEGPIAPLVYLLYTRKLRRAFERYCRDLKARAEAVAEESAVEAG